MKISICILIGVILNLTTSAQTPKKAKADSIKKARALADTI